MVFSPAIWSSQEDDFHCSKLKGLPDIVKATVPNCPPLLVAEVDPHNRQLHVDGAFYQVGKKLTSSPDAIRRAWSKAQQADENYRALLVGEQLAYPEALARLYGPEWLESKRAVKQNDGLVIGLVGHPYCLHDDYVNHNLIERLGDLGVTVRTSETVPPDAAQRGVERTTRQVRWFFDHWVSGAAGNFLYEPDVDGVIAAVAFGCGPDSTMVETITRRAHALQRPFLSLILDEHGSATGMMTRLEAFVDMLSRRQPTEKAEKGPQPNTAIHDPGTRSALPVLTRSHKSVVGIPSMGTTAVSIKSLFDGIGAQVEMGPRVSKKTVALGSRYSPEFICTPYKQILGNMIEMLEAGANTLIYVDGLDLCRNSSYHQMLDDALHDLGYDFRLVTFAELYEGGVFAMPRFLRQFAPELTWRDVVRELILMISKVRTIDEIERRVQYIRPREVYQGGVDKLWEAALTRLESVRTREALQQAKVDILQEMNRIVCDPTRRPVKIGLTGEIFAVLDPFYNQDIERALGRAGAEVHRALMISHWVQGEMILAALGLPHNKEVERAAKPYLRANVSGEGFATLGETVLCAQRGFDGVVELLPFTCEPEITALNILPRVTQDYNIPVIPFIFDEQSGRAGIYTRVEAFVDLLYRRREIRESSNRPMPPKEPRSGPFITDEACIACAVLDSCRQGNPARNAGPCALNREVPAERSIA
jgi:predicted nucleotide-binding protein (sugar kinase/HSP70/actin superfamily)